jgi:hypothetical protein
MPIQQWWPNLQPRTREWLTANNGDAVPAVIVEEIAEAGGPAATDAWWTSDADTAGPTMPDEAIDWIEEMANEEGATER